MTKTAEERLQNVGDGSFVKKKNLNESANALNNSSDMGSETKNSINDDKIPIITFMDQLNDRQRIFQFSKLIRMWEQTD